MLAYVGRHPHRHGHIALPAAKPHFTNQDIGDFLDVLRARCHQLARFARHRERRKTHHPLALHIRRRRHALPAKRHLHLLADAGRAPHRHRASLLEHQAIVKNSGQFHVGRHGKRQQCNTREDQTRLYDCHHFRIPFSLIALTEDSTSPATHIGYRDRTLPRTRGCSYRS